MKQYLTIAAILFITYLISVFASQFLFLNNSPAVNPQFLADIQIVLNEKKDSLVAAITGKKPNSTNAVTAAERMKQMEDVYANLQKKTLNQVTRGVYAREEQGISEKVYQLDNVVWVEYDYVRSNGEHIKIRIPQGSQPPPPGVL